MCVCVLLMLTDLQTVRAGEAGLEEGREDGWDAQQTLAE